MDREKKRNQEERRNMRRKCSSRYSKNKVILGG